MALPHKMDLVGRRTLLKLAGMGMVGTSAGAGAGPVSLFDGKTLNGWIQVENAATMLPASDILDAAGFAGKLTRGSDAVSTYLRGRLADSVKADLAEFSPESANARAVISALARNLTEALAGTSIYEQERFKGVVLRPLTMRLLKRNPTGLDLAHLNKMLLEDAYPAEVRRGSGPGWVAKDGSMASTGAGRGVIYTANDYRRFRLMFTMRHVSGNPDHQACVLIFCTRPRAGEKPLDALAGIQFQPPNGGRWDYRPGRNNDGGALFTRLVRPGYDPHEWSRVEIVADAPLGTARMAVAQPVGSKAVEVLRFEDASAGKVGPVAWQMHNAGLFDEFKDVTIEVEPRESALMTVG